MTDMIEKMARAMAGRRLPEHLRERAWDMMCAEEPDMADNFREEAKAALTALQEPTDEMVEAGVFEEGEVIHSLPKRVRSAVFTAMIKAIQEGE